MYDQYGRDGVNGSSPRSGHRQRGHRHRHQEEFEGFEDFDGFFGFPNFVFRYLLSTIFIYSIYITSMTIPKFKCIVLTRLFLHCRDPNDVFREFFGGADPFEEMLDRK